MAGSARMFSNLTSPENVVNPVAREPAQLRSLVFWSQV